MSRIVPNKKLLFALRDKGWTQKQLAMATHLPEAYISRFINGTQNMNKKQEELIWNTLNSEDEKVNEPENE